ncbi:hypothetical protein [Anaeromyxobacter oryzae]|uniref:Uncharacterized protein n=1 Tax=Anaeromyxobacter oryzae TaxID=2918170 RepID=A0ABN6MTI1_9BACT|nr:hypothetical protein [Anaeromyxobacter oryzae]BDG02955.1 hypothetical protein AMOR_19510 [Anaeromyxobacter oryzae]
MAEIVLDRIQFLLRENRERGDDRPRGRPQKIFVDPGGRIRIGDTVPNDDRPGLSEVHQAVFA